MTSLPSDTNQLSALQQSLFVVQKLKTKLAEIESAKTEPIAIVGMSCRFPGGADNPEAFWQLLYQGVDAIAEVPSDRWDVDTYYDPNPDAPGKIYTRSGAFLKEVDKFDPQFFGISPREATNLDPQQRLLLEVSWEALENAGQPPQQLASSQTGVYVGIGQNDYAQLQMKFGDPTRIDTYSGTGNGFCFASGRLSYVLGLQGPNMAIDTACSSSLIAIHLACQSLRAGECHLALAGGVQLVLSPEVTIFLSRAHALSPDGRCKTFDASANGYGRGEGCGIVVLKRLSDAIANNDNILAVIRGSAINHDGPSSGLTVPNGLAQQKLINEVLKNAKVEPAQVSYVETHGTGTALGDPIEVEGLGLTFGKGRSPENPLMIGSVKTNIGHLEAAAGVAGLMKVVLALQNQTIPPHLHFQQPNPHVKWDELPITVPTQPVPWLAGTQPRIAGLSSFGISGTNAHIIIEEAPKLPVKTQTSAERPLHLLTLSAKTSKALQKLIHQYQSHLVAHPEQILADICFSANTGREHFGYRLGVVAATVNELAEKFQTLTTTTEVTGGFSNQVAVNTQPKIAYLMTGQGSQYVGMAKELYHSQPTFKQALDKCDQILSQYLDTSILDIIYAKTETSDKLEQTAYTQPALFAIEYALCQLWQSWGIAPSTVMGHSVGEYVAACIAGIFSLEDGLKLIAARGRLMQALPHNGAMAAVMADAGLVKQLISPEIAIAAINAPQNTVISGTKTAVNELCGKLHNQGIKTTALAVSHAFHSPLMQPMLAEFAHIAQQISYHPPQINIISNITGELVRDEMTTAEYWCRHILQPVQFAAGVRTLQQLNCQIWLEVGPKPVLLGMARQCLDNTEVDIVAWLPSLRPGQSDWQQILASLAQMYVAGVTVNWSGFDQDYGRRRVLLPTYPFQRQRFWVDLPQHQTSPANQTAIANLLHQGDTAKLIELVTKAGNFSPKQSDLLPEILEILVKQHHKQLNKPANNDWLYRVQWQAKPRQDLATSHQVTLGSWLIFADSAGVGEALAAQLQQQGQHCLLVYPGDSYAVQNDGTYSLNPSHPEDFAQLIAEVVIPSPLPLQRILHMWSLDADPETDLTIATLAQAQNVGCGSLLHLVQALVKQTGFVSPPSLWLVTKGAMPVETKLPAIAQAPIWGFGRVISLEYPQIWGGMVDLAADTPPAQAAQLLLAEIADAQGEDHIAWRSEQRYVARLVQHSRTDSVALTWRPDSTYLITGGLGALGLHLAQWMVDQGVRHLVLLARRAAADAAQAIIHKWEQMGVKVLVAQADVSNYQAMYEVFQDIQTTMPPLRGVIHAAGVPGVQGIADIDMATLNQVLYPKVLGGWILHTLTADIELDFFVGFSSIASVWGSKGQAHYAAANHFLDMLAYYRQSQGKPTVSVNWGPWAGGGMTGEESQSLLDKMGVTGLEPRLAIAALEQLLTGASPQVTVANVNWQIFKGLYEMRGLRPLFQGISVSSQPTETAALQPSAFLEQLQAAPATSRQELLINHIKSLVAQVLGFAASELPDIQTGFFEMGMDSLMAVELKNRLEKSLGLPLPATLAFEAPNIQDLARYLATEILGWEDSPDTADATTIDAQTMALLEVEQLTDDEVRASMAQELGELESLLRGN
ncbi:type I polyketide synthase [Nostoc sp. UHCC 0702]|nr:type I polyketide synthase [Nostoc sp. UHCC 0702]